MNNFEDAVGKWCLVRRKVDWFGAPLQAMIIELSPSGKYVKYKRISESFGTWIRVDDLSLLEILYDAK